MYTVLRVLGPQDLQSDLAEVMASINHAASLTAEPRHRGDGFVISVSSSPLWEDHLDALHAFLDVCGDGIAQATRLGARPTLDVAVEPEDRGDSGRLFLVVDFDPELLGKLSTLGVRVEVTSYNGEAQRPSA